MLHPLSSRLHKAEYNVPTTLRIFGRGLLDITDDLLPGLIYRCREDGSKAAQLLAFWILLQPADRKDVESLLGKKMVETLLKLHLIGFSDGQLRARASLYPCLTYHFFADPIVSSESAAAVPWLGKSGYALALAAPRKKGKRSLDIGCGAGVQTVLQATDHDTAIGVDDYAPALQYARLNADLNGVEKHCQFVSNLADASGQFDAITARLPYAPTASQDFPFLRDLAERLTVGGTLVLAVRHSTPDAPLLERMQRWLGGGAGWGLAQLGHTSRKLLSEKPPPAAWVIERNLVDQGFQSLDEALVCVRRLAAGHPGWHTELSINRPHERVDQQVQAWLDAQDRFSHPDSAWEKWRPRWSYAGHLLVDCRKGVGMARYEPDWFPVAPLDRRDVFLLDQIDGRKTAADLVAAYADRWGAPAQGEVARRLGEMGRQVLIQ